MGKMKTSDTTLDAPALDPNGETAPARDASEFVVWKGAPSLGRIVHVNAYGRWHAAIVTDVRERDIPQNNAGPVVDVDAGTDPAVPHRELVIDVELFGVKESTFAKRAENVREGDLDGQWRWPPRP